MIRACQWIASSGGAESTFPWQARFCKHFIPFLKSCHLSQFCNIFHHCLSANKGVKGTAWGQEFQNCTPLALVLPPREIELFVVCNVIVFESHYTPCQPIDVTIHPTILPSSFDLTYALIMFLSP